jgi:hypothetical protein
VKHELNLYTLLRFSSVFNRSSPQSRRPNLITTAMVGLDTY